MKTLFRKWLIEQQSDFINGCGIDCILSKVNDELKIINANEHEAETLAEWIDAFCETLVIFEA